MNCAEPDVSFVCEDCGSDFMVKARYARMIRRGDQEKKCRRCVRKGKASPVTDTDRRYWLSRYTDMQIAQLAVTCFDCALMPALFHVAKVRAEVMGSEMPAVMMASGSDQEAA